jgi:hypothetical protein
MPATLTKSDVVEAVDKLPEGDVELEDIVDRLILLHKVQTGLHEEGQGLSQKEARKQFEKPPGERSWR